MQKVITDKAFKNAAEVYIQIMYFGTLNLIIEFF